MFYISDLQQIEPSVFKNELQKKVYETFSELGIPVERVDTDEAISMETCRLIEQKLNLKMVNTLFLCNRQQTAFYIFVTTSEKPFKTKEFSTAMGISRVSFASEALLNEKLGVKIGAATFLGVLKDSKDEIQVVFDKEVLQETHFLCSDGVCTSFMKVSTENILQKFLPHIQHNPVIIDYNLSE